MVVMADPCATLEHKVRQRVRDDESHRRVAAALTAVAIAAMHPARHLGVGRGSCGMLDEPIASATHAAVETLIAGLEDLVETMPRPMVEALANEQVTAELGME